MILFEKIHHSPDFIIEFYQNQKTPYKFLISADSFLTNEAAMDI